MKTAIQLAIAMVLAWFATVGQAQGNIDLYRDYAARHHHEPRAQPKNDDGPVIVEAPGPETQREQRLHYRDRYRQRRDFRPWRGGARRRRLRGRSQRYPRLPETRGTGTRPTYGGQLLGQ